MKREVDFGTTSSDGTGAVEGDEFAKQMQRERTEELRHLGHNAAAESVAFSNAKLSVAMAAASKTK